MPTYSSEAIVLKKSNFGEADQIVTLLTRYRGKTAVVAKGVRRMNSRKGGNLDNLNNIKAYFAEGKNMDIITEVDLISSWPKIKSDLEKISLAYQIIEPLNGLMPESQENQAVFKLTLEALNLLENTDKSEMIVRAFQVKLLSCLGFEPELDKCVGCGSELSPEGLAISAELGGVIGPEEREVAVTAYPVSAEALKVLRFFRMAALKDSLKLKVPPDVASQVSGSLQYYLEALLERDLKSPELLRRVRKLNA